MSKTSKLLKRLQKCVIRIVYLADKNFKASRLVYKNVISKKKKIKNIKGNIVAESINIFSNQIKKKILKGKQ